MPIASSRTASMDVRAKATAHDRGLNACREKRDAALRAAEDEGRLTQDEATCEGMIAFKEKEYMCRSTGKQINLRKTRRPKGEDSRAVIGSRIEKDDCQRKQFLSTARILLGSFSFLDMAVPSNGGQGVP